MVDAGAHLLKGLLEGFVLDRLSQGPRHGYAILKDVEEAFGVRPHRNRIYPLLGRLVADGLVVEDLDPEDSRRTRYAITPKGRRMLADYADIPDALRATLARWWGTDAAAPVVPNALGVVAAANLDAPTEAGPLGRAGPPLRSDLDTTGPAAARSALPEGAPYPCEGARVEWGRDVRTGEVRMRLRNCPMGAYDYCPLCPMAQAASGLRRLALGDGTL